MNDKPDTNQDEVDTKENPILRDKPDTDSTPSASDTGTEIAPDDADIAPDERPTREVPALKDEWKEKAAEAAASLEDDDDWGGEGDAGVGDLAASVAAASGAFDLPAEESAAIWQRSTLGQARKAQADWVTLRAEQRYGVLRRIADELVTHREDYIPSLGTFCGRPMVETLYSEFLPLIRWLHGLESLVAPSMSESQIGDRVQTTASYGVVGVVSSSWAPFGLPLMLALSAAVSGSASVILTPAEHPRIGELLRKVIRKAGLPENLIQIADRDESRIQALVTNCDKTLMDTEPKVAMPMARLAVENGRAFDCTLASKNILCVLPGVDMDAAVDAATWLAYAGGGCLRGSTDRVVIHDEIYDEFRMQFVDRVRTMNSHHAQLADTTDTVNTTRFETLITDARAHGARLTWPAGETQGKWIRWKAAIAEQVSDKCHLSREPALAPIVALYRSSSVLSEARRLLALAPASMLNVVGVLTRTEQAELPTLPVNDIRVNRPSALAGRWLSGASDEYGLPANARMLGLAGRLQSRIHEDGLLTSLAWFPYSDDKVFALMDVLCAQFGTSRKERFKAALKLRFHASRRELLR